MGEAALLEALARQVAEGAVVDWSAAQSSSTSDHGREVIERLRILAQIAEVHAGPATDDPAPHESETSSASPARRWGHLRLLELVGEGTFGEMYRAWDEVLDREVALKLIKSDDGIQGDVVVKEGRLLARVRHPNVATVYGADRIDGRVGIWMEFIRGRSLSQMIAEHGPYNATEAAAIGREVCRALAAVHRAGLLHRDVKAGNVMREHGGRLVLTDFGAGQELAHVDQASSLAGTPHYLAPEVLLGTANASVQSDVYAVGVLLFHLVTDAYPVTGRNLEEVRDAHTAGHRELLRDLRPDLPDAFVEVVERATAVNPSDRFSTAGALEQALALSGNPVGGIGAVATDAAPRPEPVTPSGTSASAPAGASRETRAGRIRLRWWLIATAAVPIALAIAWWQILAPPQFIVGPYHWIDENSGAMNAVGWVSGYWTGTQPAPDGRFTFNVTNNFPSLFLVQPKVLPNGNLYYVPATNAVGSAIATITLVDHRRPFGLAVTSAPRTFEIDIVHPHRPPVVADDRFDAREGTPLVVGIGPPIRGLTHLWRAEHDARDAVPGGVDGTLLNGAGFVDGRSGQAFGFDGKGSGVTMGSGVGNFGAKDFSLTYLIKTNSQRGEAILGKRAECGPFAGFVEFRLFNPSDGRVGGRVEAGVNGVGSLGSSDVLSIRRINDGIWHAVAVTRTGPTVSIYVDGIFDSIGVAPTPLTISNAADLNLGNSPCIGVDETKPLTGALDEIAIYDRALSADEVHRLYNYGVLANDSGEGDLMTAVLVKPTTHGAVTLNEDGTFSYVPTPGFHGADSFTYQAKNLNGDLSSIATVTITVGRAPGREQPE